MCRTLRWLSSRDGPNQLAFRYFIDKFKETECLKPVKVRLSPCMHRIDCNLGAMLNCNLAAMLI
jgi:hypothetical protein